MNVLDDGKSKTLESKNERSSPLEEESFGRELRTHQLIPAIEQPIDRQLPKRFGRHIMSLVTSLTAVNAAFAEHSSTSPSDGEQAAAVQNSFTAELGWKWALTPQKATIPSEKKIVRVVYENSDYTPDTEKWWTDSFLSEQEVMVRVPRGAQDDLRLVVFDSNGNRELAQQIAQDDRSILFRREVNRAAAFIGVEAISPVGLRMIAERAFKPGVLPYASKDEPFAFELSTFRATDLNGSNPPDKSALKSVKSEDLHGKVVVIFESASWCTQCHIRLPELQEVFSKHKDDMQVIHINHDERETFPMAAKEISNKLPQEWLHVAVALSPQFASDWSLARTGRVGGYGIPRVTILDTEGNVHWDPNIDGLPVSEGGIRSAVGELIAKKETLDGS